MPTESGSVSSPTPTQWLALACALLGIAFASILLVIAETELSPYAAIFDRISIAGVVFALWWGSQQLLQPRPVQADNGPDATILGDTSAPQPLDTTVLGLLLLSGLAFSSSLGIWAWSLTQTSVANSTLLNNMMPIFTTLGAWAAFGERFSQRFLLGIGIAIAGVIVIGVEDLQVTDGLVGDGAALLAAMLFAVNILCVQQLRKRFDAVWIMMWTSLIGSGALLGVLWVRQDSIFPSTWVGWTAVVALALLSQALGQGLLTHCLKTFSASLVAVSMLVIPVLAAVLAMIIFGETLSALNWMAFAIVLFGIYISVSAQAEKAEVPLNKAMALYAHSTSSEK
ncbi:MAG: DMT family transporter [Elainellaceae cyanobacterium]